jgi:hypothetical protein
MELQGRLKFVPLLAAGLLVYLGLVLLGGLTGLLWHIGVYAWWIVLNPSILGPTWDWVVWGASFLVMMSPSVLELARARVKPDLVSALAFFILPFSSLVVAGWSYFVGATLLVGSGFLAAYALVSRSRRYVGIETGTAARLVCAEVFAFLTVTAAGGVVAVLLWGWGAFTALTSGSSFLTITDTWLKMLAVDVELFFLARPLLLAMFFALLAASIVALFMEPLQALTRRVFQKIMKGKSARKDGVSPEYASPRDAVPFWKAVPYVILAGSVGLGVAITLYPYTIVHYTGVLGSDSWFYMEKLRSITNLEQAILLFQGDRGLFIMLLFLIRSITGLSPEWVVRLMPALLSALLALSSFTLVKEGTRSLWVAALTAVFSVVSSQTMIGMSAGIITNWFALSVASFAFALVFRSVRLRSRVAVACSVVLSFVLLASYAYMWVIFLAVLVLVILASLVSIQVDRDILTYDVKIMSGILLGAIVIPIGFLFLAAIPLLGFRPEGLDSSFWLALGWNRLVQAITPQTLNSALPALERAFDYTGNRLDLPFLTLLSIIGLLDCGFERRLFRNVVAAMTLIAVVATVITPDINLIWRGLYLVPLYLTGALGAESVIRRVNGQQSSLRSADRLAFTGTFVAYLFLSQLDYWLRAVELLIMVHL